MLLLKPVFFSLLIGTEHFGVFRLLAEPM